MAEIKPAGDVFCRVVEDRSHISRECREHLVQVIGPVLEIEGVRLEWEWPRGVPRQSRE